MFTAGSQLVRFQHKHLMGAGASARERLKQAAAEAWGVERSQVEARLGVLTSGNRTGTYGEFAEAAAKVKLDKEPEINIDPAKWWLLGKSKQRLDIPNKVNGSAQYAIDTRIPGMVYAAVKASPVPWGTLKSYNFDAIKSRPGVIAVVPLRAVPKSAASPTCRMRSRWSRTPGTAPRRRSTCFPSSGTSATASRPAPPATTRKATGRWSRRASVSGKPNPQGGRDHRSLQQGRDRVIRAPVRDPCPHGADQRDSACAARSRRRLVADAGSVGGNHSGCRPAQGRSEDRLCPHHVPRWRLRRQRCRRHRRHPSGGRDLQAGRQAGEGDLVARGGPGAGQAASARGRQAPRRHRRRRLAHGAVHPRGVVPPGRQRAGRQRERRLRHLQHAVQDSAPSPRAA